MNANDLLLNGGPDGYVYTSRNGMGGWEAWSGGAVCQGRLTFAEDIPYYMPLDLIGLHDSVNTGTEVLTTYAPHGLVTGTLVTPEVTAGGLTALGQYYVRALSSTTLAFYTTLANAEADSSRVNLSGTLARVIRVQGVQSTTLKLAQYNGDLLRLPDGSGGWVDRSVAAVANLSLSMTAGLSYDVFAYDNAGTPTLELTQWDNSTVTVTSATPGVVTWTNHPLMDGDKVSFTNSGGALPTGISAGTDYYVTVISANTFYLSNGRRTYNIGTYIATSSTGTGTHTCHSSTTHWNNIGNPYKGTLNVDDGAIVKVGAGTRLYLGSILCSSAYAANVGTDIWTCKEVQGTPVRRYLWNHYNRLPMPMLTVPGYLDSSGGSTYTTTSTTWVEANSGVGSYLRFFTGLPEVMCNYSTVARISNSTASAGTGVGVGEDDNVDPQMAAFVNPPSGASLTGLATNNLCLGAGYRILGLFVVASTGTGTFNADQSPLGAYKDPANGFLTANYLG